MSHYPLAMRILLPQPFGYLREFVLAEYQLKDTFGAITQPHRANDIEPFPQVLSTPFACIRCQDCRRGFRPFQSGGRGR